MGLDMYYYAEKMTPEPWSLIYGGDSVLDPVFPEEHSEKCMDHEVYVGGWEFAPNEEKELHHKLIEMTGLTPTLMSPHFDVCPHAVKACVAYWRKANAVHGWIVDNMADGVDDCQAIEMDHVSMGALILACRTAIRTKDSGYVPPRGGFFFGSTEVDEYYWADLEDTIRQLAPLAEFPGRMYYRASW